MLVLIAEEYESDIETGAQKDNCCMKLIHKPHGYYKGGIQTAKIMPSLTGSSFENNHFILEQGKTTRPEGKGWVWDEDEERWFHIRRITPREAFRLMDVKDSDIDRMMSKETDKKGREVQAISNTQLYKCAGNSIVVAPMALTFENLLFPEATEQNNKQLTLF